MKSAASIAVFLPLLAGLVLVTVPTHAQQRGQERPERSERLAERGAENSRAPRRQDSMASPPTGCIPTAARSTGLNWWTIAAGCG